MDYDKGDLVWFDPGLGYVLPGEVQEYHRAGQVITVQAVIGGKSSVFTLSNLSSVRRRQDLGMEGVNDMITISDLNEASLLWNLKIRYDKEQIYTYIGGILISVNPYKMSDIYGLDTVKRYEGQILGTLPPHIFAIGSACYSRLSKDNHAQCVVISGESGAGKTEATKLIMQYLAAVNKSASNLVTEQILEASPLLESFGNAKTVKNDNSSRFGKYLEIFFKGGVITGARVTEYLLEKSRMVTQAAGERNYHVFYEMLAGLSSDSKNKYGLTTADKYFYLNQGGSTALASKEDGEDFNALLSAIQVLGFSTQEQDVIFRILATVLHLGNVYFHRKQLKHGQEAVEIGSQKEIKWAAHLLQIDSEGIIRALTTKSTEARNERLLTTLNIDQALDARDAVAKALYSALFSWLVRRINQIVCHNSTSSTHISVLDIFGFESFKENSFEQLCINYANEKLQFYFNKYIFKLEQQEYAKEKIEWQNIDYLDNQPVIELLSRKPVGILHLLDDESNFPKATDVSFLEKCHYNHALNDLYSRPRMSSMEFGIQHYAGQVWYSVDGFLDKNRDTLRNDVVDLLISSKLKLVSDMFLDLRIGFEKQTLNKANGRFVTMKPRTPTVAARFHDSLHSLTDSMTKCNPWFVRCVKPNHDKSPLKLDMPCVLEQLRYSGMLQTIQIRQQGFPVRLTFSQFADRYRCLVPGQVPRGAPAQEICKVVLQRGSNYKPGAFQLGTTKIFLKEAQEKILEQERYRKLSGAVVLVQRYVRGYLARRRYQTARSAAIKIQSAVRMHQHRQKYLKVRKGVVKAQALAKGRHARKRYSKLKEELSRRKRAAAASAARASAAAGGAAEEQQRQQRTVAAVNHLEVPAELAFVFSKSKEWQPPHSDKHITRAITAAGGSVHTQPLPYTLPPGLDYYPFTKFTNVYFKSHLWGMKREPIRTPFLSKARDSDYADSLAIFKLILRFMNDASLSKQREIILADYIANKGLQNESLRDEILCQLCNQTWRNGNTANAERGWLLMSNCLSVFQPSDVLHNYLLKYVTDNAPPGYASLCQHKILSSHARSEGVPRSLPPSSLEWRANARKARMALEGHCPDGKSSVVEVDSWTTGSEFAAQILHSRGIETSSSGWSVALVGGEGRDGVLQELPGEEYVLDLVSGMERAPAFPCGVCPSLNTGEMLSPSINGDGLNESPVVARRSRSPPLLTRKLSKEALEVHDQAMTSDTQDHLSRSSALNSRYFDDKSKSRSLDNLMEPLPGDNMPDLGLSSSRLNERYHSVERLTESGDRTPTSETTKGAGKSSVEGGKHSSASKGWAKNDDLKGEYPRAPSSSSSRYIKAPQGMGRRGLHGALGAQNSRAYIEREYMKSSAMSDTSEAPSLASHVRRVRVPSQASDVDQYVDDLFIPVLEHQMPDDLSDARSLAASLKGGGNGTENRCGRRVPLRNLKGLRFNQQVLEDWIEDESDLLDVDENVMLARTRQGSFRRLSLMAPSLEAAPLTSNFKELSNPIAFSRTLRGGGAGAVEVNGGGATSGGAGGTNGYFQQIPASSVGLASPPMLPMTTMPLYSPGGLVMPGLQAPQTQTVAHMDPTNLMAYQQNLQRAYIQSAVAQNIQIQQHLMAQNQALQQLLTPNLPVTFQEQDHSEMWTPDKSAALNTNTSFGKINTNSGNSNGNTTVSPPPPLLPVGTNIPAGIAFSRAAAVSSPLHDHEQQTRHHQMMNSNNTSRSHDSSSGNHKNMYDLHSPGSPPSGMGSHTHSALNGLDMSHNPPGHIPAAPPLPTHLNQGDMSPGFMDPYQRAKTVRIGKWRWPPPKEESDASFLQFKMKQNIRKSSNERSDLSRTQSQEEGAMIDWDEFDMPGMSSNEQSPRKENNKNASSQKDKAIMDFDQIDKGPGMPEYRISRSSIISARNKSSHVNGGQFGVQNGDASKGGSRRRRDSWDNPVDERSVQNGGELDVWGDGDEERGGGIGKLKISREMKEKLEALTSSGPVRVPKSGKISGDKRVGGVKKLEEHRRLMLQQQLTGGAKWGDQVPPPPPVAPPNMGGEMGGRRAGSPALSASSLGSSAVIPQPRSPPPSIQPMSGLRGGPPHSGAKMPHYRSSAERSFAMDKPQQFELEESSEFLPSVDRGAPRMPGPRRESREAPSQLLPPPPGQHITYVKVPWKLAIRKEVFFPGEVITGDALQLVMCQVVKDTYYPTSCRMADNERETMRKLLESHGITPHNCLSPHHSLTVRNEVVGLAKSFSLYFAALYPVTGSRRGVEGEMVAVSHSGLRLVRREGSTLVVTNTYPLEDIEEVESPRAGVLHVVVYGGPGAGSQRLVLYTPRSPTLAAMIGQFASAAQPQGSRSYVRAVADYKTRESRLLSFKKGDIIRVSSNSEHYQGKGWLEGSVDGHTGLFPMECVVPIGRAEARLTNKSSEMDERTNGEVSSRHRIPQGNRGGAGSGGEPGSGGDSNSSWGGHFPHTSTSPTVPTTHHPPGDDSGHSSGGEGGVLGGGGLGERNGGSGGEGGTLGSITKGSHLTTEMYHHHRDTLSSQYSAQFANDGKHSLLQFALKYFRMSKEQNLVAADGTLQTKDKNKKKKNSKDNGADWTWKEQVEMVKFTQSPLSASLLPLDSEISWVAVDMLFLNVMRYMGDYPMEAGQNEVHCVYAILHNCHKYEPLRDELYCQIMKQTTSNKSSIPDSCQRGWRLFSIIAAYFSCSEVLKPYLFKYLETNAYDKRRAFHGTAMVTLQNLRKTFKYGGRKNVPSVDEVTALTAGRNSRREIYRLPGGTERVINTRSTSVVQDILEEMCHEINVTSADEQDEFSMYCLVEGESFTMPLGREEYILDVTTELRKNNQVFYLIFCRSVWYYPLRLDTPLYVEVVFNQVAPDYLEGLLLVAPGEKLPQHLISDISKVAALMHRAADLDVEPSMSEVKFLLPKQALVLQMAEPAQWFSMVSAAWPDIASLTTTQAKAQVLEILEQWDLFGSSFFTVKRIMEGGEQVDAILALNKRGVHFLDYHTHETIEHYALSQVFSTRKVKSEDGYLYLDMKFGNLLHHRITRIQTVQAHEISRLFRQYITIEQRLANGGVGQSADAPRDVTLSR